MSKFKFWCDVVCVILDIILAIIWAVNGSLILVTLWGICALLNIANVFIDIEIGKENKK